MQLQTNFHIISKNSTPTLTVTGHDHLKDGWYYSTEQILDFGPSETYGDDHSPQKWTKWGFFSLLDKEDKC